MSVVGKKPFVNYIIDECSVEQANQVISIMNSLGTPIEVSLYGNQNLLSEDNIGVSYVTLKVQDLTKIILNGILVYLDETHCGFFGIASNSDNIAEYRIDPINRTFERIYEYLTIEELRQVCGDRLCGEGGGSIVEQNIELFDKVVLNIDSNIQRNSTIIDNNSRNIYIIRTSNNVDDIKKALKLLSNSSSVLNFVHTGLEGEKSTTGSILKWTNYNDNGYVGLAGDNSYVTNIDENSLGSAITQSLNCIEKAWLQFSNNGSFYGFKLEILPYAENESNVYTGLSSILSSGTVTLEIICPKDEINVQGSQGSGITTTGGLTRLNVGGEGGGTTRNIHMYFLADESYIFEKMNAAYTGFNQQIGQDLLNTNCSTTSDLVANLNIIQSLGTIDVDNTGNSLIWYAIVLLSTDEKCIKVTADHPSEFNTDLNSFDLVRSYSDLMYVPQGTTDRIQTFAPQGWFAITNVQYAVSIEEVSASGGSDASDSDSTPGIDYINLQTRKATQFQIKISFKHGELETHKEWLNNGITAANTQYGLSIPLFNELDDLITIFEYVEGLGNQTLYDTLMASFLFVVNYFALSITTVYWDDMNGQSLNVPTQIHANSVLGTYEIEVVSVEDTIPTVTINGVTYNIDFSNSFIVLVPVAESGKNYTYNIRINAMD